MNLLLNGPVNFLSRKQLSCLSRKLSKGNGAYLLYMICRSLEKSGKEVKPVKVIEICKPRYSGELLELNDERIISVMMPCRISVYEKDDGKTYVALINPGFMASGLPESITAVMSTASDEVFEIVRAVTGKQ